MFSLGSKSFTGIVDKSPVTSPDNLSLNRELASQLQDCVYALETKQPDSVVGMCRRRCESELL